MSSLLGNLIGKIRKEQGKARDEVLNLILSAAVQATYFVAPSNLEGRDAQHPKASAINCAIDLLKW